MPAMERKKTLTMNWDGLGDDDDDDRFFEAFGRVSCASQADLASSSDDEDFEDSRLSFASAISSVHSENFRAFSSRAAAPVLPDYDVWMAAPGSIKERRRRLLQGMGLSAEKELLSFTRKEITRGGSEKGILIQNGNGHASSSGNGDLPIAKSKAEPPHSSSPSVFPMLLVRSRSDGDIDSLSLSNQRKEELIGKISKQRITRTHSMITSTRGRICTYPDSVRISPIVAGRSVSHRGTLSSVLSSNRFGAFFLIKNLDTGKEFIVSEYDEDGMWNRFSDLQTGKQLTVEEFEKCVGYSPVVKELMRRENVSRVDENGSDRKVYGSYLSKSLRTSKRRGAALLKNIRGSMSGLIGEKEREVHQVQEQKPANKNSSSNSSPSQASSEWIKVRQSGKTYKELSALHLCQEIQAHEGSIWTIKFSLDARFLASAGEDRIVHLWEVQECEVLSLKTNEEGSTTPIHPYFCSTLDHSAPDDPSQMPTEKKKKGKGLSGSRKGNAIPDYVHVPEYVFSLSEKPICSFKGHLDDVLDLSWSKSQLLLSSSMDKTVRLWDVESKSCLKLFAHNDYVTCIQFNPADDNYFISGSLDAKVRLWNIPDRHVVDWTDLHEMVTAASYTPDGQSALIGSHKGSCRMYSTEDCRLDQRTQIDVQNKKKSHAKKITGFQFSPINPSEVLVTSADSRIRILDGSDTVHKFRGFKNASSQIAASFSQDGKYVISASEDSQVHVWKREEQRNPAIGKGKNIIVTRAHEHFECRDVSVAIPWPGVIKGEPPAIQIHSKRHSKRSPSQPPSASVSPSRDEFTSARKHLPPLPKKNLVPETNVVRHEEDLARVTRAESGIGESFSSASASMRFADSPSISSAAHPSTSWSSSWPWFDGGNNGHGHHAVQATAWGLVIVTAGMDGEIRAYQNFGLPRRIGRHWTTA